MENLIYIFSQNFTIVTKSSKTTVNKRKKPVQKSIDHQIPLSVYRYEKGQHKWFQIAGRLPSLVSKIFAASDADDYLFGDKKNAENATRGYYFSTNKQLIVHSNDGITFLFPKCPLEVVFHCPFESVIHRRTITSSSSSSSPSSSVKILNMVIASDHARGIIYEVVDKEVTIGDEGASVTSTVKLGKSIKKGAPWKLFSRTLKVIIGGQSFEYDHLFDDEKRNQPDLDDQLLSLGYWDGTGLNGSQNDSDSINGHPSGLYLLLYGYQRVKVACIDTTPLEQMLLSSSSSSSDNILSSEYSSAQLVKLPPILERHQTVDSFKVRYNATEMVPIGFQDGSFFLHFNESTVVQQFTPSTAGDSRRSTFEGVRFTDQIVGTVIWQYSLLNRAMTTVFSDFETPSRLEHMFTIDKMNLKSGEVDSSSSSFLSPLTLASLKAPTDEPSESPFSSSSAKTLLWLINKHQLYSIFFRVLPSFGGKKTDGETTNEQPNEENNEKTPESEVAGSRNDELSAELTKAEASKAETFSIDSFLPTMHKSAGSFFSNDWFLSSYYPDLVCELSLRTNLTMRAMQNYYINKPPRPFLLNYVHLLPGKTGTCVCFVYCCQLFHFLNFRYHFFWPT